MKPFNLTAAKRGDPICTQDGEAVHFIGVDPVAGDLWARRQSQSLPSYWGIGGSVDGVLDHPLALRMASKKRTVFVNIYEGGRASWHGSKEGADQRSVGGNRFGSKAWPVEIEE